MEHQPIGLACGAVTKKGKLAAYTMKIRLENGNDEIFYLGYD